MKVAIACDHGGFELKQEILGLLKEMNVEFEDFGSYDSCAVDYPDYAFKVSESVAAGQFDRGILICGTGIGMSIAANKVKGIRCAHVTSNTEAMLARAHNNANIIALGVNNHKVNDLIKWIDLFLTTDFKNEERHVRRNKQIMEYEQK